MRFYPFEYSAIYVYVYVLLVVSFLQDFALKLCMQFPPFPMRVTCHVRLILNDQDHFNNVW